MNKTSVILAIPILLLLLNITQINARPREGTSKSTHAGLGECVTDGRVEEACQRCAKITKSTVVYPMCCRDEDRVYEWCVKYVSYGIQSS